jgi:hypothetical protein
MLMNPTTGCDLILMRACPPDPTALATQLASTHRRLPPVDHWDPPFSGDIDIEIARDGVWRHDGDPIQREALVRLFASILRRDDDRHYYLVTPVEKWRIRVNDAPFVAVRVDASGSGHAQILTFTTNLGDTVIAGPAHPLTVVYQVPGGEPSPYIHIRGQLLALLSRAVFIELAELGEEHRTTAGCEYGVWSQGEWFSLGRLDLDHAE